MNINDITDVQIEMTPKGLKLYSFKRYITRKPSNSQEFRFCEREAYKILEKRFNSSVSARFSEQYETIHEYLLQTDGQVRSVKFRNCSYGFYTLSFDEPVSVFQAVMNLEEFLDKPMDAEYFNLVKDDLNEWSSFEELASNVRFNTLPRGHWLDYNTMEDFEIVDDSLELFLI